MGMCGSGQGNITSPLLYKDSTMAFTKLADRLKNLPLVLAGPILRQVTKDSVTVWIALKQSATVTLNVYDSDNPQTRKLLIDPASRATTAVGTNLHIVAVTARKQGTLSEGHIYFYDLTFTSAGQTFTLSQAVTAVGAPAVQNPFAYPPFTLPGFALPPKDITKLRLFQGSCRKAHGEGADALAILDGEIRPNASDPVKRPHQLVLGGDQIYADDVADALLLLLTDAGKTLLGWSEPLPMPAPTGSLLPESLPPYLRQPPLQAAGFTSDDVRSHLLSLGEYFAMYLFGWSDVLWPDAATKLDTYDEMFAISFPGVDANAALTAATHKSVDVGPGIPAMAVTMAGRKKIILQATADTETFRTTLPAVRTVLANIPSYMICDDHEFTDDWNMTRRFCQGIYGGDLGVRVAQNALVAFSICQSWGNTPEQFAEDPQNPPGLQLLQTLQTISASAVQSPASYTNNPQLMTIVGVHTNDQLKAQSGDYRVFHDTGAAITINGLTLDSKSLRYNFSIEGDGHQVIVTDSRTWRSFPTTGLEDHSQLLPPAVLNSQMASMPALGNRQLIVLVTTNAPPIASIREVETFGFTKSFVYVNDLRDSWDFPSANYDQLLTTMNKMVNAASPSNAPVVVLSGDVHFGFSSRLAYWADVAQFGDPQGQGTKTKRVFAQLVSSSLKNETDQTRGLHLDGYTFSPHVYLKPFAPLHVPEGFIGWNASAPEVVATQFPLSATPDKPTLPVALLNITNAAIPITLKKPDYRYRLDYLSASTTGQTAAAPVTIPTLNGASTATSLTAYQNANGALMNMNKSGAGKRDCVGHNNIGEIGFSWNTTKGIVDHVYHTLRWQEPNPDSAAQPKLLVYSVTYDVSTDIDDPSHLPIKAPGEA